MASQYTDKIKQITSSSSNCNLKEIYNDNSIKKGKDQIKQCLKSAIMFYSCNKTKLMKAFKSESILTVSVTWKENDEVN